MNFYRPYVLGFVGKKAVQINKKSHKDGLPLLGLKSTTNGCIIFFGGSTLFGYPKFQSKMKSTHGKPMCGVYLWHRVCVEIEEMDNPYAQLNNLKKSHVYDF